MQLYLFIKFVQLLNINGVMCFGLVDGWENETDDMLIGCSSTAGICCISVFMGHVFFLFF